MLGRNKKEEYQKEKPIWYYAKYLGGHPRYPSEEHSNVLIYSDRVKIALRETKINIKIPYSDMKNMQSVYGGRKIDSDRVFATGVIGLVWQKKRLNTIIEYNDGTNVYTIALDFDANMKYVEPIIRERMANAQHISLLPKSSNVEANQPIISIESKLSGNIKRENQIIGSNKDNDNVSKSKMPISIPSHPVNKTGQAPNDNSPSNQIAENAASPLTTSNAAKMNDGELLQILKLRLVKGEISKEEYLELRRTIES